MRALIPPLLSALLLAPPAAAQEEPCPRDVMGLRAGASLACTCTAAAVAEAASVAGSEAYTGDSRICRAALHAGVVGRAGGPVRLRVIAGVERHPGATRNGVRSADFGPWRLSFTFEEGEATGPRLCPDRMIAYPAGARLACLCTGEAALRQAAVWGSDPYTADSGLCRAALHAGAVPVTGGMVTVLVGPGRDGFPASARHGVQTRDFGPFRTSFAFEGPPNTTPGEPAQAPVLQALRREGRVALYVHFRTNSAAIEPVDLPLLGELRDALRADPALRLRLVGHTDSQGGPGLNGPLSQRRAQAVRAWLIAEGVPEARLAAEGRGQAEPIADNGTEPGRALNRRVEAVRVE